MANANAIVAAVSKAPSLARNAAIAAPAMRTVGYQAADPAVVRKAATTVANLSKTEKSSLVAKLGNRKLILGGTAVGGAALVGYSADELFELLNAANPGETLDFLELVDDKNAQAGDDIAAVYNDKVTLSQLDTDFGAPRSDDLFLSQAPVSGLGLDRNLIEAQQVLVREYAIVRNSLTFKQILALQFILAHATPEDVSTLEDMHQYRG